MPIAAPSRMYESRPMMATSRMTVGPITRAIFVSPTAICCWNRSLLLWSTLLHDDHVAEVALPVAQEVAEPEVVREVAEAHVEALVRHVGGEGLDGSRECGRRSGEFVHSRCVRRR